MYEACVLHLGLQLVGMVEVGGREVARVVRRVAVLPVLNILLNYGEVGWIVKEAQAHAIERGGEARDGGGQHQPARPHDASRFMQRRDTIAPLGQVVERPE